MDKNLYDIVLERLRDRQNMVRSVLKSRFYHTQPFRQTKLTDDDILTLYDTMQEQDWYNALDKYGKEPMEQFKQRAETIKMKRGGL